MAEPLTEDCQRVHIIRLARASQKLLFTFRGETFLDAIPSKSLSNSIMANLYGVVGVIGVCTLFGHKTTNPSRMIV